MAFLLGGEVSRNAPCMTCRRAPGPGFPAQPGKVGRSGGSQVVPAQTRACIQMGRIPIGGIIWYFQSIR